MQNLNPSNSRPSNSFVPTYMDLEVMHLSPISLPIVSNKYNQFKQINLSFLEGPMGIDRNHYMVSVNAVFLSADYFTIY